MGEFAYQESQKSVEALMGSPERLKDDIPIGYIDDQVITQDFTKLTNMLVTGTTGSGKTVFVQTIMCELMLAYGPDKIQFVVFDSKIVDYAFLNGNTYLSTAVINKVDKAATMINWLISEAEKRLRDISEIDAKPHLFVVFDDYHDISQWDPSAELLGRLFQIGRQARIHCILVTSTPSAQIISTELKANMPYKIAFHTATKAVSRMIIDESGAENLICPGEMIFVHPAGRVRCQSVYMDYHDIERICDNKATIEKTSIEQLMADTVDIFSSGASRPAPTDPIEAYEKELRDKYYFIHPLLPDAARYLVEKNETLSVFLQTKFKMSFESARRIVDQLCLLGIISKRDDSGKPSAVLVDPEGLEIILEHVKNAKTEDDLRDIGESIAPAQQAKRIARLKEAERYNLTPQSKIEGEEYSVSVSDNRIVIEQHYTVNNTGTIASFRFGAQKLERLVVKKPGLFSGGGYIQFVFTELRVSEDEKNRKYSSFALDQTKRLAMDCISGNYLTIAFKKKDTDIFLHFMQRISYDVGIDLIIE